MTLVAMMDAVHRIFNDRENRTTDQVLSAVRELQREAPDLLLEALVREHHVASTRLQFAVERQTP